MALSIPPYTSRDRTLPNPAELLPNGIDPRRSSSLLQHHIASLSPDQFVIQATAGSARRNTVADLPTAEHDRDAGMIYRSERQDSIMSGESPTESCSDGTSPPETSSGYCLCAPDPKIPRPRNAFILYRQNQHADVVKAHPGLPNPDISKIIGEQWRRLSPEEKDKWKAFAEQEKARHSQQFPDYRYRPKRSAKYSSNDGNLQSSAQSTTCAKCGGKTMNPPHTPHYSQFEHHQPATTMSRPLKRPYPDTNAQPRAQSISQVGPPPFTPPPTRYGFPHRHDSIQYTAPPPNHPSHGQHSVAQHMVIDGPEAKRRRIEPQFATRPPYYPDRDRASYAHAGPVMRHQMPPPLSQRMAQSPIPQNGPPRPVAVTTPRRDLGLTLPPLKTGTAPRRSISQGSTQKSGVEAMIMSYPILTKLKTLHSITPILQTPGPTSPPFEVRGAIIAVEGLDQRKVIDMTQSLAEQLEKDGKFMVRIFSGPQSYTSLHSSRRASISEGNEQMTAEKYLHLISNWHKVSRDMVDFITRKPSRAVSSRDEEMSDASAVVPKPDNHFDKNISIRSPISAVSPMTTSRDIDIQMSDVPRSALRRDLSPRITRSRIPKDTASPPPPPPDSPVAISPPPPPPRDADCASADVSHLIPIAIVPHYQLTTVDTCSIALPIFDNYDPLTHWRWHATLWRGCVGPDVSVVIKSAHETHEDDSLPNTDAKRNDSNLSDQKRIGSMVTPARPSGQAPPSAAPATSAVAGPNPVSTPFGVDVRLQDHRAVIIRAGGMSRGSNASESISEKDIEKENENWEKAKRRVAFEVEEWMRR